MVNTTTLRTYLDDIQGLLDSRVTTKVISHCRHVLQHYPRNVEAYRLLARAMLDRAERDDVSDYYDEALEVYQRVLSVLPNDRIAHQDVARIREQKGQLDQAVWHMERAHEQQPGDQALREALQALYAQRAGTAPAKLQLSRGALIRQYINAQLYDQALIELRAALNEMPNRVDLQVLLAETLWETRHAVEAGETAVAILTKLPYCLSANRVMARLWLDNERPTDAQAFLDRLEAVDPYAARRVLNADASLRDTNMIVRLDYETESQASLSAETPDWVTDLHELEANPEQAGMWTPGAEVSFDAVEGSAVSPFVGVDEGWFGEDVDLDAPMAPLKPSEATSEESFSDWLSDIDSTPEAQDETEPESSDEMTLAADWFADIQQGEPVDIVPDEDLTPDIDFNEWSPDQMSFEEEDIEQEVPGIPPDLQMDAAELDLPESLDALSAPDEDPALPGDVPEWLREAMDSPDDSDDYAGQDVEDIALPSVSPQRAPTDDSEDGEVDALSDLGAQALEEHTPPSGREGDTRPLPLNWVPDTEAPVMPEQPEAEDETFAEWLADDMFDSLEADEESEDFGSEPAGIDPESQEDTTPEWGDWSQDEGEAEHEDATDDRQSYSGFTDLLANIDRQGSAEPDLDETDTSDEPSPPAWLTEADEPEAEDDVAFAEPDIRAEAGLEGTFDFSEQEPEEDTGDTDSVASGVVDNADLPYRDDDEQALTFMTDEPREIPHEEPEQVPESDAPHDYPEDDRDVEHAPVVPPPGDEESLEVSTSAAEVDEASDWIMDPEYDFFTPADEQPVDAEGDVSKFTPEAHDETAESGDWLQALDEADASALEDVPLDSEPAADIAATADDVESEYTPPEWLMGAAEVEAPDEPVAEAADDDQAPAEVAEDFPDWLAQAEPADLDEEPEAEEPADDLAAMFDSVPDGATEDSWDQEHVTEEAAAQGESEHDLAWLGADTEEGDWLGALSAVDSIEDGEAHLTEDEPGVPDAAGEEELPAFDAAEAAGDSDEAQIEIEDFTEIESDDESVTPAEPEAEIDGWTAAEDASSESVPDDAVGDSGRERSVLESLPTVDESPAWLAGLEVSETEDVPEAPDDVLSEPYDPFERGSADQVPVYDAAAETGVLQPDELPPWMTAFTGEEMPPEEDDDDDVLQHVDAGPEEPEAASEVMSEPEFADMFEEFDAEPEDEADMIDVVPEAESEGAMPSWLREITQAGAGTLEAESPDEDLSTDDVMSDLSPDKDTDQQQPESEFAESAIPTEAPEPEQADDVVDLGELFDEMDLDEGAVDEDEPDVMVQDDDTAEEALLESAGEPEGSSEIAGDAFDFDAFLEETDDSSEDGPVSEPEIEVSAGEVADSPAAFETASREDEAVGEEAERFAEETAAQLGEQAEEPAFEFKATDPGQVEFDFEEPESLEFDFDEPEDTQLDSAVEEADMSDLQASDQVAEPTDMAHTKVVESEPKVEDDEGGPDDTSFEVDEFAFEDVVPAWLRRPKEDQPSENDETQDVAEQFPEWLRDVFEDDDVTDTDEDDVELD